MAEGLESARHAVQEAEREAAWRDVARKLAHEFKNMLTPMRLSLQMLETEIDALPADRRETSRRGLEAALGEVAHLDRLAEQFSQYARLPEPSLEPLDLAEVARAVADLEGAAVSVSGGTAPVRGDRMLLTRAAHNLVRNAREAGPAGATVEVRTAVEDGRAVIEVLDRGPGLPEDQRARAFEPYVSTKKRGSGLGLSLVRDIARRHGGVASLEPRDGGGLRARLLLPLESGAGGAGGGA
jgi:two-component system nitrogen regulation sensor histidine kinase NtrY